jgi:hypothetical protein
MKPFAIVSTLGAVVGSVLGCNQECHDVSQVDGRSFASPGDMVSLVATPSEAFATMAPSWAAEQSDAGREDAPPGADDASSSCRAGDDIAMARWASPVEAVQTDAFCYYEGNPSSCTQVQVYFSSTGRWASDHYQITFDLPPGVATYHLEVLHATVCEGAPPGYAGRVTGPRYGCTDGMAPTAIAGALDVHARILPCGGGACGDFDADIVVLSSPTVTSGPTVSGKAHLSYAESAGTSCIGGSSVGTFPATGLM